MVAWAAWELPSVDQAYQDYRPDIPPLGNVGQDALATLGRAEKTMQDMRDRIIGGRKAYGKS